MQYWELYKGHSPDIRGTRKKFDNTIYTFDIETTSYIIYNNQVFPSIKYKDLTKKEQETCEFGTCMYIWQFSINKDVYYGRTWQEFILFLDKLEENVSDLKYVFVHNLSFEFQFLKSYFAFTDVTARKAHKVMTAKMRDYNILFKCSYIMSNAALSELPKLYKLPVEKKVGDLDYEKLRHFKTKLTDTELGYCEYDCLVVYYYILEELKTYEIVKKLPTTSTGKVRRELMEQVMLDFKYKRIVNKAINTNPHIYNLLVEAFAGGYTHSNYIYTDEILENVDSYDETSAYPYILVTHKFPNCEFKKCNIKSRDDMIDRLCYLLVVKFKNIKSKYFNNFISSSKCRNIKGAKYDNGRIIEVEEIEIVLTDIDFYFILDTHKIKSYEILESYVSTYAYLPKKFINFVLDKYVKKTEYKNVLGMELEYIKEKNKFNALYGMSVTNTIRDNVIYDNDTSLWKEEELTNDEIIERLNEEKGKSFLSFAYGVWVTAYARNNLLRRVIELDEYVVYCDTDSIKLVQGYDKNVFINYNKSVEEKIKKVSKLLRIDFNKYAPSDKYGVKHLLGVFESDAKYDKFITQGAKKYAYEDSKGIHITVAGVPKKGSNALKKLDDFKDNLVFKYEDTGKNLLIYCENQPSIKIKDYLGCSIKVYEKSGCCLVPTTYILSKSLDYCNLISDNSSKRAKYRE